MASVWRRVAQGMVLATGAPLGWLALRAMGGHHPLRELSDSSALYAYLTLPTMLAFALFGAAIGLHEARLEEANERLEETSVTDELTGLKNLRYFRARLLEEGALAKRNGSSYSLVIVDLDHFKRVNDEFGHVLGDRVLVAAARALASVSRQADTAARVGGEEFALLLPGTGRLDAAALAERVRGAIRRESIPTPDGHTAVTASAGVASTDELPQASPDGLYAAADSALYQAKRTGRNRVVLATASGLPAGTIARPRER